MRVASWGLVSVVACLSLAGCNDDEPPIPDTGTFDAGDAGDATLLSDVRTSDVFHETTTTGDVTTMDHRIVTMDAGDSGVHLDGSSGDGQAACGTSGPCASGTTCVNGGCTACGTPGQACCADAGACGTSSRCGSDNYCQACGSAGQACCLGATACNDAGCCDLGVCTPSGSACPGNGGMCKGSSCGGACPDAGCGACGAAGQTCCANIGCTASVELLCETTGGKNVCAVCGTAGAPCCAAEAGVQCSGGLACSASGTCVNCGGVGQPVCP